jgi:DNA repair photolyase
VELTQARSIFSPATGFIRRGGFGWTCNPYVGCTFGCSYCYAAFLPQNRRPREDWGRWFEAKANAVDLARRQAPRVAGQAVYLSSVTDPYQPVERSLQLTRGILEAILPYQPRLAVQTRGPLVVHDADLLRQFAAVRVNVSLPTDCDEVRKAFEPKAPPLEDRWAALTQLRAAGIPVGVCVTPMLPLADAESFARRLAAFRPDVLVVQEFHDSRGGFGADTGAAARRLAAERNWTGDSYRRCVELLRRDLTVFEAETGFFPPGAN